MNKSIFLLSLVGLAAVACSNNAAPASEGAGATAGTELKAADFVPSKAEVDSVSYLLGVNFFDCEDEASCGQFVGTIIHEFAHILDGNIAVPIEYDLVTKDGYIGDQYSSAPNDYLQNGFLSNYARSTPAEDIAVMVAALVGNDADWWESTLSSAGDTGRAYLEKKRDILVSWLRDDFGIDVYDWHDIYTGRVATIDQIDWDSLDD